MAGVGDSVVVSRGGLEEDILSIGKDEKSLQELIDSELALRVAKANREDEESRDMANATLDFLEAESRHASLCLNGFTNTTNTPDTDSDADWTTVEEAVSRMSNPPPAAIRQINEINHNDVKLPEETNINSDITTNTVCVDNNYNHTVISETFTTVTSKSEIITTTTSSTVIVDDDGNHVEIKEIVDTSNHNGQIADISQTNHKVESIIQNHNSDPFIAEIHTGDSITDYHDDHDTSGDDHSEMMIMEENERNNYLDQVDRYITNHDQNTETLSQQTNHIITSEEMKETTEKKSKKKKTIVENGESISSKTKKKKSKKSDEKENHISVKSSFSKFDQLSKKTVLHVRSSDPAKAQKTFSQGGDGENPICKACGKTVFVMEQIKAERAVWHKNCFRCQTCKKQLTIDIYSSHEGELYCKPHFKELFTPKAVVETEEPVRRRRPEMIIRENQPLELPPDVIRASDKPDLGLEELSSLNVKSKFQVFERAESNQDEEKGVTKVDVKRSPSILSKLAKFQKRGMDVGVTDQDLDGFVYEESSSEEEQDEDEENEEGGVIKCRKVKEKPISFVKMDDVKKNWESGATRKEEMLEQKKQDMQNLRSRLFMGKQVKMKEMYEQAVAESEGKLIRKESDVIRSDKAKAFRERFEKGEVAHSDDEEDENKNKTVNEDLSVFEEGISKKSRSIFLEMDAKTQSAPPTSQPIPPKEPKKTAREVYMNKRQISEEVVKSSDKVEDVTVQTADLSTKFKFFEKYKAPEKEKRAFRITPPREGQVKSDSPEREVYRDPTVVRSDEKVEEDEAVKRSQTASKMLSIFRQMEEQKPNIPEGPKPKKEFTPPPDFRGVSSSEEEDESEEEEESDEESNDDGVIKSSYKTTDEFLQTSKSTARAKDIAAKFESWEPEKQSTNNAVGMLDSEQPSLESTKSLRAHFESLKNHKNEEGKSRPKVNRFVDSPTTTCSSCENKVYPLEKIETDGKIFHKNCFRCSHCNCILRMDSYTLNAGHLYCMHHFKQLFITKGNYDEGFGVDQHKRKWEINGTPA